MTAITIDQVARAFGTVRAIDDVSLEIRDGVGSPGTELEFAL